MKKQIFSFILASALVLTGMNAMAQNSKEAMQAQKEMNKYTKDQLTQKATKEARKAAKQY